MKSCILLVLLLVNLSLEGKLNLLNLLRTLLSIQILDEPKLAELPKKNELSENMSYVLSCMLSSGSQPVHFEWLKDNLLLEDRKRHKIENHETISLLSLQKLQRKDSGSYTCNVKNQFGTDSTSTQLLIKGYLF